MGVAIRGSLDLVGVRFPFQPRLLHESRRGVFSHIADSLLHLPPGPSPSVGTGVSNVWLVTCKDSILALHPSSSFNRLSRLKMASPAHNGPCRLFKSKEGCRYGKKCKFSHDLGSTSGGRTPLQSPPSSAQSSSSATARARPARSGNPAPRNVCDFYWNTGQCNRGFDCTFKHQKNTNPQSRNAGTADKVEGEEDAANAALEFFTMDNLTQMAGVGLHSTQEGTPENAHNSIKRYLGGGPLNTPADMKPLAAILASVNRRNHSWVRTVLSSAPDGYLPYSRPWIRLR